MKILMLQGWQSTPGDLKPTCLKNHGHTVLNLHLSDDDFAAAVRIAQTEYGEPSALSGPVVRVVGGCFDCPTYLAVVTVAWAQLELVRMGKREQVSVDEEVIRQWWAAQGYDRSD